MVELDAFASLEKSVTQKTRSLTAAQSLAALEDLQHSRWSDPYAVSSLLRKSFRGEKVIRVASQNKAQVVHDRYGLGNRVGIEDLRTPARPEDLEEERIGWEAAKGERRRREDVKAGKRKADQQQIEWNGVQRERKAGSGSQRSATSSSKPLPAASAVTRPSTHSSSRHSTFTPLKAASTSSTNAPKSNLSTLTSQILLNSAIQTDPFRLSQGVEPSRLISSNAKIRGGMVKLVRKGGS